MPRIDDLRRQMVQLELDPLITGRDHDAWVPAFERVPRHRFLPCIRSLTDGELLDGDRAATREHWLAEIYSGALVSLPDSRVPMALCRLQVSDLADLFEYAGVTEGHRVLVLGAGQGYVPALLCERLGDKHVTVTDPDRRALDEVVDRLRKAGYRPTVEVAPAEDGHPGGAPYDCVITNRTRDTLDVPPAWLSQVRGGGRVLVVLSSQHVVVLDVRAGGVAEGRFEEDTSFVVPWLPPPWAGPADWDELPGPSRKRRTTTVPATVCDEFAVTGFPLYVRLHVGEIGSETSAMYGTYNASFCHRDGSWANVDSNDREKWTVVEGGPRKLWTEIEAAYRQWCELGEPALEDYRLTVTPESLTVSHGRAQ